MKKTIGYRIYKELTDNQGNIVHRCPFARTGNLGTAIGYARAWSNGAMPMGIYEMYSDGTERRVYGI